MLLTYFYRSLNNASDSIKSLANIQHTTKKEVTIFYVSTFLFIKFLVITLLSIVAWFSMIFALHLEVSKQTFCIIELSTVSVYIWIYQNADHISNTMIPYEATWFSIANIFRGHCGKKSFWVSGIGDPRTSAKRFQALSMFFLIVCKELIAVFLVPAWMVICIEKVRNLTRCNCSSLKFWSLLFFQNKSIHKMKL